MMVQDKFYENMALAQAWLSLSRSGFVSAIESVRNRILTFALEAEPFVGADENASAAAKAGLSHVFHTYVYGSVGNLAQGSSDFVQHAGISAGDLSGLLAELQKLEVPQADCSELAKAIAEDGPPQNNRMGPKVSAWLGRMVSKAASGAWNVVTATASTVLPKLLQQYYNLPP